MLIVLCVGKLDFDTDMACGAVYGKPCLEGDIRTVGPKVFGRIIQPIDGRKNIVPIAIRGCRRIIVFPSRFHERRNRCRGIARIARSILSAIFRGCGGSCHAVVILATDVYLDTDGRE